jgi:hypothetical protein
MTNEDLINSYNTVHDRTWSNKDFLNENLNVSRSLYIEESIQMRIPVTKKLHVVAFLYGLPFNPDQQNDLVKFQKQVKSIIGETLVYFVKPQNFGLELAVLKWPEENLKANIIEKSIQVVTKELNKNSEVNLILNGFQINPDGCIVARGIDLSGEFLALRKRIMAHDDLFPKKQSGWVHIPLGRILEPLGIEKFNELKHLVEQSIQSAPINFGKVGRLKLVNETQWYMEERKILNEF